MVGCTFFFGQNGGLFCSCVLKLSPVDIMSDAEGIQVLYYVMIVVFFSILISPPFIMHFSYF